MSFPTSLTFFFFSLSFQCGICGFTIATGGAARLVFGYDSYGNTCGQRNEPIEGVRLSGLDHTDRKWVGSPFLSLSHPFFFLHSAPSQTLTFSSSSFSAFTHPFFSVVNGQRWNQSTPALALRLSHQCKCQTAGVSPRDGWGLSELHTRALNNSVQALRTGTVTVCGP